MAITYLTDQPKSSKIQYLPEFDKAIEANRGKPPIDPLEQTGETSPTGQRLLENADRVMAGYGLGTLGSMGAVKAGELGAKGINGIVGKIRAIRNAPQALEEALGAGVEKFGTAETPSMVGNTARAGLESEQSLNEALAQKLYGKVSKDIPVNTPKLAGLYGELGDELSPNVGNAIKKRIQLEPNPIRPGDVGEYQGITTTSPDTVVKGKTVFTEHPPTYSPSEPVVRGEKPSYYTTDQIPDKVIPGEPQYGVGYKASPGVPSQLPPNNPAVGDLIKLRAKLGAVARTGGIDGHNAGRLIEALDQDIANIGAGEGPLGKMTNEVTHEPLTRATNYYREMRSQQNTPLYRKLSTGKIEDIPNIIFKNGRTQDVLEARAALGDQGFNAAKKSFFNDVINSKDVAKTLEKYGKSNSDFLRSVFNESELNSINTIADLQKKATQAAITVSRAKMLMTGTGAGAAAVVGGKLAGKAVRLGVDAQQP